MITDVVAPNAAEVDNKGIFPRASIEALGKAGLLGLIGAKDVGGLGEVYRAAALENVEDPLYGPLPQVDLTDSQPPAPAPDPEVVKTDRAKTATLLLFDDGHDCRPMWHEGAGRLESMIAWR